MKTVSDTSQRISNCSVQNSALRVSAGAAGVAAAGKKIPLRSRRSLERKQTRKLKREKGKRYPVGDPEIPLE